MQQLLIFDCDGVLVDSEYLAVLAEVEVLANAGFSMTEDEIASTCVGLSYPDMMALLEERFGEPMPEGLQVRLEEAAVAKFPAELREVAGMGEFLDRSDITRCVASSGTPERIALSLGITGLDRAFRPDAIFSSKFVENGKPAPDLFLHAAAEMKFDPADCIVVEDSPHGIAAAKAAGMTSVGLTAGGHMREPGIDALKSAGADHLVASVAELELLLGSRLSR